MSELVPIRRIRRHGEHEGAIWIANETLNCRLAELNPFADFYVMNQTTPDTSLVCVFETLDKLIERLHSATYAGDTVEIYAVDNRHLEIRAKVPDMDGNVPLEDDDFAHG